MPEFYTSLQGLDTRMDGLCRFVPDRAFTGELPLGIDMSSAIQLATIALEDATEIDPELLRTWSNAWMDAGGNIGRIYADQRNDEFRTDLLIAGATPCQSEDSPSAYPALSFAHSKEAVGTRMLTDIHVGLGFVDEDDRPIPAKWLGFDILGLDLNSEGGVLSRVAYNNLWKTTGAALLAEQAALVTTAASDPLKAAILQIYEGAISFADVTAGSTGKITWRRSSKTPEDNPSAVEVARLDVAGRYGEARYIQLIRVANRPQDVKIFTDDEWEAFAGGVQDGEFDLD